MASAAFFGTMPAHAARPLTITIPPAPPVIMDGFKMGTARNPAGATITVDSRSLRLDGRPWNPVMGEFHFSRYPATEWREELLKMKAGGIDIVATYVFWIHHEEIEARFDWSGQRDLRGFIEAARDAGLKAIVRCGPWCHGEVRNGGIPDWAITKGLKVRTDDDAYLGKVRVLYGEIAKQLHGLLWKEGGPVVGIQLENEYSGPAEHLLTLKGIARECGLDVPLYTRTGWPELRTPMPFGEILPLHGVYAEGFWDRETTPMPGRYWSGFHFSLLRTDANIANELLGRRDAKDAPDVAMYPYLTCEIGGGMMNSYHRRILIDPADVEATTLVKVGSGGDSPGYYMYHGGTNPEGVLGTLMEQQDSPMTNWNDMPVKNYDFQAPLGEYGQVRPHYHMLRRLHLFLRDFGHVVGTMETAIPDVRPAGRDDTTTLRWAVRSDGRSGLLFVNNHERLRPQPAKQDVQFALNLAGGALTLPSAPVEITAGSRFFWPFNLDLGHGVRLVHATAQPLCMIDEARTRTVFFAETAGIAAEFSVAGEKTLRRATPGRSPAFTLRGTGGRTVRVVLLDAAESLSLYKETWLGRDRVFLTPASLVVDGGELHLTASGSATREVAVFPAPRSISLGGTKLQASRDGVFTRFALAAPAAADSPKPPSATAELLRPAGPPREIPLGRVRQPVAVAPSDADFADAAAWRIKLPPDLDLASDPLLRLHYVGDVARVMLNGRLITDDFYNGNVWEIGLRRHAPDILEGELLVAILPLQKDAVGGAKPLIYMADSAIPGFGDRAAIGELDHVEIVPRPTIRLSGVAR